MKFVKKLIYTFISVFIVFPFFMIAMGFLVLKKGKIPGFTFLRFFFNSYCQMSDILINALTSEKKWSPEDLRIQMTAAAVNEVLRTIPDNLSEKDVREIFGDFNAENKVRAEDPEFDKLVQDYEKVLRAGKDNKNGRDKD